MLHLGTLAAHGAAGRRRRYRAALVMVLAGGIALFAPTADRLATDALSADGASTPAVSAPLSGTVGRAASTPMASSVKPLTIVAKPASDAVVHQVSSQTRAALAAYWTPSRLAAAHADESGAPAYQAGPSGIPTASSFSGVPSVGALFSTTDGAAHFCTASVVNSPAGNLITTAAHCLGGGSGSSFQDSAVFVPEYHDGQAPLGIWVPETITVAHSWQQGSDTSLDIAFVTVTPASGGAARIQDLTGANTLDINRGYHQSIRSVGYPVGAAKPVACQANTVEAMTSQLRFDCHGFFDGTSGSPLLADYDAATRTGVIVGDIGGYERGGTVEYTSYSPAYGDAVGALYARAAQAA
jgi:V8-like Glu-specific endopeptidase